ncbi:MAG: hypothetical protein Q7T70_09075 [Polaromonas sp.]|nr:hypothetical protein [Polaromonas sp.]
MRFFLSLALPVMLVSTLAAAQTAASAAAGRDTLALAVSSQKVLNEYAIGAMDPDAMKYTQRVRLTRAALDAQYKLWPAAPASPVAGDAWAPWRVCQQALQQASSLAALSARKAVSAVNEAEFQAAKAGLQKSRSDCAAQIQRAGKPG